MQGSCKHGSNCPFPHPPLCFKVIGKGSKGCDKGYLCTYAHPKLCQASVANRRCNRKICNLYRIRFPQTQPSWHSNLEKGHLLTPLMQIKLHSHPIPYTKVNQPSPVFLSSPLLPSYQAQSHNAHPPSQESDIPSPAIQQPSFYVFRSTSGHETSMSQMQQAQNLKLQNLMNNMWPMLPGQKTYHPTPLCTPN